LETEAHERVVYEPLFVQLAQRLCAEPRGDDPVFVFGEKIDLRP
jgi:hypothetical protein